MYTCKKSFTADSGIFYRGGQNVSALDYADLSHEEQENFFDNENGTPRKKDIVDDVIDIGIGIAIGSMLSSDDSSSSDSGSSFDGFGGGDFGGGGASSDY